MAKTKTYTFHDYHKPQLLDGEYTVTVSQNITLKDGSASTPETINSETLNFHIDGPKFDLDPSLIQSVYPPKGGKGDYMAALPKIVLNRSTLPWERRPHSTLPTHNSASWLFLLLVDESEKAKVIEHNGVDLATVQSKFTFNSTPVVLSRYPDKINYISVDSTLSGIFPNLGDLEYLSYSRTEKINGVDGEEKAVLLGNRLPKMGSNSTVYLVSLENRYGADGNISNGNHDLPYLYKWDFHAFDDELFEITAASVLPVGTPDLSEISNFIYKTKESFELALQGKGVLPAHYAGIEAVSKLPGANFDEILSNLPGGFKPFTTENAAAGIASSGSVSLDFHTTEKTQGDAAQLFYNKAWYRGPLAAAPIQPIDANFPLHKDGSIPESPNSLFLTGNKGEDATYAAAFELGKLTALNDTDFCNEFYKWKSETALRVRLDKLINTPGYQATHHLPITDVPQLRKMPKHVRNKFKEWKSLKGLPYRYLIPDPTMLPNESIRFFRLDPLWINSFLCGAFSIGKTVKADLSKHLSSHLMAQNEVITGFLINSLVVAAWPDYEVNVTGSPQKAKSIVKNDLDVNIQLQLFSGAFQKLTFHLHTAKAHSGFHYANHAFTKKSETVTAQFNEPLESLKIGTLKTDLGSTSIADFGSQMMESTHAVVFEIES